MAGFAEEDPKVEKIESDVRDHGGVELNLDLMCLYSNRTLMMSRR